MQDNEKKPALRFKGFTAPWEQRKLGEISSIKTGPFGTQLSAKEYVESGVPVINVKNIGSNAIIAENLDYVSGETFLRLKEHILHNGDIVFGRKGALNRHAMIQKTQDGWIQGSDCIRVKLNVDDSNYLDAYLQVPNVLQHLSKIAYGSTMLTLTTDMLYSVPVELPQLCEEKKIGDFFKILNNLITLHQRKYEKLVNIKKSMLDKMFPKNGASVPEIRFKGFTDPWEQRKLGDAFERVVRKNTNNESRLPLTISAQDGLVDQITYFNNRVASRDVSNYYLVYNGEFAYNKSTSDGYPFGAVKRLDWYEKGVLSTLYIVFALKHPEKDDSDFMTVFYDTDRWHRGVAERAAEGARNHGLLNISADDFFDIDTTMPEDKAEQKKIGRLLKKLDTLITLHQRKLEKLQNIKKSCLEKMFV